MVLLREIVSLDEGGVEVQHTQHAIDQLCALQFVQECLRTGESDVRVPASAVINTN